MQKVHIRHSFTIGGARFDLLKFVLAILIMVMHSGVVPRSLLPITRLCVPLFFIMTSYFFHGKLKEFADPSERRNRLIKFVKRNVSLYLFWSIAMSPVVLYIYHFEWLKCGVWFAIISILKSILITGFFPASWFIVASVYAVIIVFGLSKWFNYGWLFFVSLMIYVVALLDSNYGGLLSSDAITNLSSLGVPWSRNIPAALIWIVIGKILAEKHIPKISSNFITLLIVCAFVLYYSEFLLIEYKGWSVHTDCYLTSILLCSLIFVAIMQRKDIICKNTLWLRKSSIIMYCFHRSFILLLTAISSHFIPLLPICIFFVTLIVSLCVAAIIIWLYEKKGVKILKYSY